MPGLTQESDYETGQKLQNAAAAGDLATVRRIIDGGFDVNYDLGGGSTVLHMAASCGRTEIVKYLLAKGADPTIRDSLNRTPAAVAQAMNQKAVLAALNAAEGEAANAPPANQAEPAAAPPVRTTNQPAPVAVQQPTVQNPPVEGSGIALFYAGRYAEAAEAFRREILLNPGDPAPYLWHGIALVGAGQDPSDTWHRAPVTNETLSLVCYLEGLGNWKIGAMKPAEMSFLDTNKYPGTLGQQLTQQVMGSFLANGQPPNFTAWPGLARLPGAK